MKRIFTLLISITFSLNGFAQPAIQWQKTLGGSFREFLNCISKTSDGGFIIAGSSNSNDSDVTGHHGPVGCTQPNQCNDIWIVKIDSIGNIQWEKSYGGTNDEQGISVEQTADGGYIVAGSTNSADGDVVGHHGSTGCSVCYDLWLLKIDASGNIQWQSTLGGTNDDGTGFYHSGSKHVQQTSDGGYIVTGYASSNDGDVVGHHTGSSCTSCPDYWVVKLSSVGTIQWQKCLGGSLSDFATSIQQTTDGGYIVAGSSVSNDGDITVHYGNTNIWDFWVVKLSASGNIQWQKTLGGTNWDEAYSVFQNTSGDYIVFGITESNNNDVSGNHGGSEFWLVNLDPAGNIQWQKCYGGYTGYEWGYSAKEAMQGGYILVGFSSSNDTNVTGGHGGPDYWVVKVDNSGNIEWEYCYGGTDSDEPQCVVQTSDGHYVVAGTTYSINGDVAFHYGGNGTNDYWIIQLSFLPTGTGEDENKMHNISVYPNPAASELRIENGQLKIEQIEIYNTLGEKIYQEHPTSNVQRLTISVADFPSGIYFLKVKSGIEERVAKFVKE